MTDKKYSRLGSRIVFGTVKAANTSSSDDEDIFLSDSVADRPELRVQLRYFTVELKPSRGSCGNHDCGRQARVDSTGSVDGRKQAQPENIGVPPFETSSCDSFHSCRSTTSVQELAFCKRSDVRGSKKSAIRDDDLLNHLTMVNAIFLSKSVSDASNQRESATTNGNRQLNANSCKTDILNVSRTPSSSNRICSEAYTCQVNHNPRVKYISKVYGNNVITKPVINSFDTLYGKFAGDRLSYTKTFSESFEPVLNYKKSGLELVDSFSNYDRNDLLTGLNEALPSNLVFPKKTGSVSSLSVNKRLEIKVPEMKFAEIIPLGGESYLPLIFDQISAETISETEQRRRKTLPGCEESLKVITPKSSSSVISIASTDNDLVSTPDMVQGDGDYSGYAYTENSGNRFNKHFFKDIDDTYLKMLISKSFKKIQSESESNVRAHGSDESDIFESDEELDGFNEYEANGVKKNSLDSTQPSLQFKKLRLHSCFEGSDRDRSSELGDERDSPFSDECQSEEQGLELVTMDEPVSRSYPRGLSERTRTLPVIQEESSEECEDFRQDDLADDYCLIDSNGRPIHLFDKQGLPLTDNSGRPLRSAQGKRTNSTTNNITGHLR